MDAATHTNLAQILSLAGLIGATIAYAEIIKRRARLLQTADRHSFHESRSGQGGRFPNALLGRRETMALRSNQFAGIGWAAIGLLALVVRGLLSAWRAVAEFKGRPGAMSGGRDTHTG